MEQRLKNYFKNAMIHSKTVTRVAATGGSGAGKTTSTLEFMNPFGRQFIYSNIGAIQSSKIRTVIIPLNMESEESDNACLYIHFMKNPEVELIMKEFRKAISEKLVKAYRTYEEEDAEDIVRDLLSPSDRIYDITEYCNEEDKVLIKNLIDKICRALLEENDEQRSMIEEIKIQKANAEKQKRKFEARDAIAKEIDMRLDKISLKRLQEQFSIIANSIKYVIKEKIDDLCRRGLETEEGEDEIIAFFENNTGEVANELFQCMFKKDGKDLVVSHLTFITAMSETAKGVFYNNPEDNFRKNGLPLFKIYDLKGLETGADSIDETIMKIRESMPDAILAYQRTNDVSDFFMRYLDAVHREFGKIPTYVILTHSDESMKAYLRNMLNSFGAKTKGDEGYAQYCHEQIKKAYQRLKEENNIYVEKNAGKAIFCSLIDEAGDIDGVLGDEKLYNPERMVKLVAKICREHTSLYRKVQGIDDSVKNNIKISFNEVKLDKIVNAIVSGHRSHALTNYYNQSKLYPHWNSVYKWRAMHRVGSGWASSARVYSNIDIYINNFISGFMNRNAICDAIDIDLPDEITQDQRETIEAAIRENISVDADQYNGFFYQLKLMITYKGFEAAFSNTYFSSALELIYTKLNDPKYIKKVMEQVIDEYKSIFLAATFD